jgi:hypothetical protein
LDDVRFPPEGRNPLTNLLVDQNKQSWVTQIARALQLQRSAPGLLDPTIQCGVTLDDFNTLPFLSLRGQNSYQAAVAVVAGVGRAYVQVYCTLQTSRMLLHLRSLTILNLNAARGDYNFGIAQPTVGDLGVTTYGPLDNRTVGSPYFRMDVNTAIAAPVTPTQGTMSIPGFTQDVLPCQYILSGVVPNSSIKIVDSVAARGIGCIAVWDERPMQDSE